MKHKRTRVRILYVILLILIGITVVPLWFYGSKMMSMNRERLETQESVLQTITSQSLSQYISLYMENLNQQLKEFFDTVVPWRRTFLPPNTLLIPTCAWRWKDLWLTGRRFLCHGTE